MSENTYPSVNDLTLEEKASLTSGGDAWHLQGVEAKGIPGYMITDGPHGLRKSNSATTGEVDLNNSVPAKMLVSFTRIDSANIMLAQTPVFMGVPNVGATESFDGYSCVVPDAGSIAEQIGRASCRERV